MVLTYAAKMRRQLAIAIRVMGSNWRIALVSVLVAGVVFSPFTGSATEIDTVIFDGYWWQGLSPVAKLSAVEGMLVGYEAGYFAGGEAAEDAIMEGAGGWSVACSTKPCPAVRVSGLTASERSALHTYLGGSRDKVTGAVGHARALKHPDFSQRHFGTIIERLDEVYNKHPKLLKINVLISSNAPPRVDAIAAR